MSPLSRDRQPHFHRRAPVALASRPIPVSEIATATPSPRSPASIVSRPPAGIACNAFSMMLVSDRDTSARSISTGGSGGTGLTSIDSPSPRACW
jgi:hypothetical protein